MRFMFDQNLSWRLASIVDAYDEEHSIAHISRLGGLGLSEKSPDLDWIETLQAHEERWAVFTTDRNILSNPVSRRVFRESGLTFFLAVRNWKGVSAYERSWKLLRLWPQVVEAAKLTRPAVYLIRPKLAKVERLAFTDEL